MNKSELIESMLETFTDNFETTEEIDKAEKAIADFCKENNVGYLKLEALVNKVTSLYLEEGFRGGIEAVGELLSKE